MDMAVHPGLGHSRRIGANIAGVAMRQIEHEEVRLLLHAADDHHSLAKVGLCVPGRVRQRHEVAGFYAARSRTIPPLPWSSFPPPFSPAAACPASAADTRLKTMVLPMVPSKRLSRWKTGPTTAVSAAVRTSTLWHMALARDHNFLRARAAARKSLLSLAMTARIAGAFRLRIVNPHEPHVKYPAGRERAAGRTSRAPVPICL